MTHRRKFAMRMVPDGGEKLKDKEVGSYVLKITDLL